MKALKFNHLKKGILKQIWKILKKALNEITDFNKE